MTMFNEQEELFIEKTGKDFTSHYTKYYPKLVYFVSKIVNDTQKAEDITSEAFTLAFDKIDKYDNEKAQFSTWLFTIAKNAALQSLKEDKRSISLDIEYDNEGTTMKDFISHDNNDDTELSHSIIDKKAKIMLEKISHLKEPYKEVIEMREIKKMAYKDISDILNRNLSTVKSQIRGARHLLMEQTKKEYAVLDELYS
jgi:RNA polymerase sigma-70 factor, ECF subfamily